MMGLFMCFERYKKGAGVSEATKDLFAREGLLKRLAQLGFKPQIEALIGDGEVLEHDDAYYQIAERCSNYGFSGYRLQKK